MGLGLFCVAFAVALSRSTGLGTSPISCLPCVLSFVTPITIGTYTFILNVIFVLIQIALLRKDFNPIQLLQIPFVFVFSAIIDLCVPVCETLPMTSYFLCLIFMVVSIFISGFGVWIQVKSKLIMLPGDSVVLAISKVFNFDFGKVKIANDSTQVALGTICSLVALGGFYGVREGTILAALTVGLVVRMLNRFFPDMEKVIPTAGHLTLTPESKEEKAQKSEQNQEMPPFVITISREFGSGGREIGMKIAKKLNIAFYDKQLIRLTAEKSGLNPEYVARNEQDVRRSILYNLYSQNYEYFGAKPSETDSLFLAQAKTITTLADKRSCVLVGRCANYILQDRKNTMNIFISAPMASKVDRVMKREHVTDAKALSLINAINRERAEHARVYTGKTWGDPKNYHLCLDSSLMNSDAIADLIIKTAQESPGFSLEKHG